mmetsp:Transcript_103931/g.291076  ORF Transcript_103931/g.291076 Transcript_103931/m.291076 type:complete len:226 (+) Transcript_103931:131-808(+)
MCGDPSPGRDLRGAVEAAAALPPSGASLVLRHAHGHELLDRVLLARRRRRHRLGVHPELHALVPARVPAPEPREDPADDGEDARHGHGATHRGLDLPRLAPGQLRGVDAEEGAQLHGEVLAVLADAEVAARHVVLGAAAELLHPALDLVVRPPRGAQELALDLVAVVASRVLADLHALGLELVAAGAAAAADADGPMDHLHRPDLAVLGDLLEEHLHRRREAAIC